MKFVERVDKRNISLKKLNANPNKALTIQPTLQKLNAENPPIKHLAEKACISYIKSVYLMKDKEVFKFAELDTDKLASSLGLANAPQIMKKSQSNAKNASRQVDNDEQEEEAKPKLSRLQKLREKIKEKKEQKKLAQQAVPLPSDSEASDEEIPDISDDEE